MHVLLTGSSGWLGRFLAPMLRMEGHDILGLDVIPGPDTQIIGSVFDRDVVEKTFSDYKIDAVIHAGGLHKPSMVKYTEEDFLDVNVTGTLNLLEAVVAAKIDRFVFTSTTSLMIDRSVHEEKMEGAVWIDENYYPIEPRNIYGATKLAAENLCRTYYLKHNVNCVILRAARFFPGRDEMPSELNGQNQKANELLNRRLSVWDAAMAHVKALEKAPSLGFDIFVLSAPTPFARTDCAGLMCNASQVIERIFPCSRPLYLKMGWSLPDRISRIYDSSRSQSVLGLNYKTTFESLLDTIEGGGVLPIDFEEASS